jgi:predicted dehydrogenase
MKIITALVGFGLSGRYLQAPFLIENPHFHLKYVVTQNSNPLSIFPEIEACVSFEAVIADQSVDLVSICSPNATHYQYAKAALSANKHVMVEKPLCATIAQAQELYALAQQQQKILYVYQNRRFDSDFRTLQAVITSGKLGKIHTYEAHFDRYKPSLNPKQWKETPDPSSGILYDLGSHLIDQAIALFGKPNHINGHVWTQRIGSEIDDAFDLKLDYGHLKVRLKTSLLVLKPGPRYVIHGDEGSFEKYGMDPQEDHLKAGLWPSDDAFGQEESEFAGILSTKDGTELVPSQKGNWMLLFENLRAAIQDSKPLIIKSEEILWQLEMINDCRNT